jgi:hypothetical protein
VELEGTLVFHVKQSDSDPGTLLFHVKQSRQRVNKEILLSNAKIAKDLVEDIFDIDPPE